MDTRAGFHLLATSWWLTAGTLPHLPSDQGSCGPRPCSPRFQSLDEDWMGTQTGLRPQGYKTVMVVASGSWSHLGQQYGSFCPALSLPPLSEALSLIFDIPPKDETQIQVLGSCQQRPEEGIRSPGTGVTRGCELPSKSWELN